MRIYVCVCVDARACATNTLSKEPIPPAPEFPICLKSIVGAALKSNTQTPPPSNPTRRNPLLSEPRQRESQGAEAISELRGSDEARMTGEEAEGRKMGEGMGERHWET